MPQTILERFPFGVTGEIEYSGVMTIYSQDLRDRVIEHLEEGENSQAETAMLFGISLLSFLGLFRN